MGLTFPLVSFGLWTANPRQVADFFALITPGRDCATFVRSMSVCSTTSVAAESFCVWSSRSVHMVDLDRVFSGALRQQSRFLYGRFCISRNFHSFCQVKVFLLEQFLLQGLGRALPDNLVSYHLFCQSGKVAGFCQLSKACLVRVERLVCLLCSRLEFVAYHVPFRGKVPIQGGLGFFEALVFAWERVENALHCVVKAMQHRGSLTASSFFCRSDAIK